MLFFCNTEQFQRLSEEVSLVVPVVLLKPLRAEAMQARRAAMMLWA